jgi:hypothetical protein
MVPPLEISILVLQFYLEKGDMNMTDLVETNNELNKTQTRHRIIFFDGIHEWAPEATMNTAFAGLELDAMHTHVIPKDNAFINDFIKRAKKEIDDLYINKSFIKAEQISEIAISMLDGLTDEVSWFKEKKEMIEKNAAYQNQLQAQQKLLSKGAKV